MVMPSVRSKRGPVQEVRMACGRGRAHPNSETKLRLFTDSGGYCQRQDCPNKLFVNDEKNIHIAEMAHIFAANDGGARSNAELTAEQRGHYNNIILLCANCHTEIDKDPKTYSDRVVRGWKLAHAERLNATFGVKKFHSRQELRSELQKLFLENAAVHKEVGPDNEYKFNPEAAEAAAWKSRVVSTIIPNSNIISRHLDHNMDLLRQDEMETAAAFKVHVRGLVMRHVIGEEIVNIRFPEKMNQLAE